MAKREQRERGDGVNEVIVSGADALALTAPAARPDQSPPLVYLATLAPASRRMTVAALNTVARLMGVEAYRNKRTGAVVDRWFAISDGGRRFPIVEDVSYLHGDWAAVRFQHTNLVRAELSAAYSLTTVNRVLSAVRGVLGAAFDLGQMSADDFQRATRVKSVSGSTLPPGRALTPAELHSLMTACAADVSPAGARDGALIAVITGCGLRRAEAAGLDRADYDPLAGSLVVRGKGRRERLAYPQPGVVRNLQDWLAVRGGGEGALFYRAVKGGEMTAKRLTPQGVYVILNERLKQAGISGVTPHDLRRTFITRLLELGADLSTVQRLAGHARVDTTVRYDRRGEAEKERAAQLLIIPYVGRTHS